MNTENTTPPPPKTTRIRVLINKKDLEELKSTGLTPSEAIKKYTEILTELKETRKKYYELKEQIEESHSATTKALMNLQQEVTFNRRLRYAIQVLHQDDYWQIIQKAERGYYQIMLESGFKQ